TASARACPPGGPHLVARPTARRARALLSAGCAIALLLDGRLQARAVTTPSHWDVTFAIRITGGTGAPISVRLALPPDSPGQQIGEVEVIGRGLQTTVVRDGPEPHVLLRGKLKGSRRVA